MRKQKAGVKAQVKAKKIKQPTLEIFVFGSNLAGIHGAGSAKHAKRYYKAKYGVGEGPTGAAYAIPTKDEWFRVLPLKAIRLSVFRFLEYAEDHPGLTFNVVRIGTGLAGYTDEPMARLFITAPENVRLHPVWNALLGREVAPVVSSRRKR